MCRTGGRRCPGRDDPHHRQVENVRRRITRNAAKANAVRQEDTARARHYDSLADQALGDLADLDPDSRPPAARCDDCGQWVGARGHDCPTVARGEHSAQAIASAAPEPTTFDFIRRREGAQNFGATYGQDKEPAGRYMTQVPDSSVFEEDLWERGHITFEQPLHMEFGGDYGDEDNWKERLSQHYDGKTGEALSQAVADDGYDGIITHDKYGTSEIVDLTHLHDGRERCPDCGQWADESHVCPASGALAADGPLLDSLNPTGTVFTGYDPSFRATAPLASTITTLAETEGIDPNTDITVFRGVPRGAQAELNAGDFITTNEQLARDYAGDGDVISQVVKAGDVLDDLDEPGGEEYVYRPGAAEQCPDCGQFAGNGHVCPEAGGSGGGDEVASLGATPFRGIGRTPEEMVADDPYFQSKEYADFQEHLARLSGDHGVVVVEDQHALGLWEGEAEPASAIRVKGTRAAIDALARDLSTRYQQDAVMVVRYDPDGPGSLHSYGLRHGDDPEEVVSALQQAGIPGARIVGDRLEIASEEKQPLMASLVERFGEPEVHSIRLDFVEKDESDSSRAPFAGMAPGSAPGEGTSWGTVRGTRDGLKRRYPGVELILQERGEYVVLNSIKVPTDEQRGGVGTRVMEDLVAEADKNGWKLALTPDTSFGASSKARLERFYRRFGFVPNKGRNKDFATTEGMVRQPQT